MPACGSRSGTRTTRGKRGPFRSLGSEDRLAAGPDAGRAESSGRECIGPGFPVIEQYRRPGGRRHPGAGRICDFRKHGGDRRLPLAAFPKGHVWSGRRGGGVPRRARDARRVGSAGTSSVTSPLAGLLQIDPFKISLPVVAAFLTIIGYSLNDTIVVFDRIREVRGKSPGLTTEMINTSINQTLSRTILTSLTTLMVVVMLYFIGGAGIHGFAFALLVGVSSGPTARSTSPRRCCSG